MIIVVIQQKYEKSNPHDQSKLIIATFNLHHSNRYAARTNFQKNK